jgi:gamma-glutamyltranspeptidase/glutathione hydrolase
VIDQSSWGAVELIEIPQGAPGSGPASSGNDSALGGRMRAGFIYGAHDDRRPAGAAVGY